MKKLIALDIDGTLLDSRKQIAPDTMAAVREAAARGVILVFCTGRAVSELAAFPPLLPQIRYAVFASGAGIYDLWDNAAFSLHGIPRQQAEAIMAIARTKDLMPQIVLWYQDVIQASHMQHLERYHMGVYRPLYETAMTLTEDIFSFFASCREDILKINLYHADPQERLRTMEALAPLPLEKVFSEISSLECSAQGVSKGTGLLRLCAHLGLKPEDCAAVGDAENDMPMLRAAGLGIAMGNADENVRRAADRAVADLDHGGCAEAIRLALEA